MVAEFPAFRGEQIDARAEARMDLVMNVIGAIRNLRSEMGIPPGKKVEVIFSSSDLESLQILEESRSYVENLARVEKITAQSGGEKPKASATAVVGEVEVFLPLKGLINLEEEEKRLGKELSKLADDLTRTRRKLENQDFLNRARPEAVEKEKEKAQVMAEKEAKLREGLERVKAWKEEQ